MLTKRRRPWEGGGFSNGGYFTPYPELSAPGPKYTLIVLSGPLHKFSFRPKSSRTFVWRRPSPPFQLHSSGPWNLYFPLDGRQSPRPRHGQAETLRSGSWWTPRKPSPKHAQGQPYLAPLFQASRLPGMDASAGSARSSPGTGTETLHNPLSVASGLLPGSHGDWWFQRKWAGLGLRMPTDVARWAHVRRAAGGSLCEEGRIGFNPAFSSHWQSSQILITVFLFL
jgi:hypothetical protein